MEPEPIIATNAAGDGIAFSRQERERHLYLVGKSGSGKSTALFNLAMHDIYAGEGVCVIDPHGDLAEAIIDALPPERTHEVCYLNVADTEFPVGFNPLAGVPKERHALAAAGIVSTFKHLWPESWGPRLEHFLFNGVAALLSSPRPTLIDLPRLYTDARFREPSLRGRLTPLSAAFGGKSTRATISAFKRRPQRPSSTRSGKSPPRQCCATSLGKRRRSLISLLR